MLALTFGLTAACAWAVHDLLVRKIGQTMAVLPMMLVVLASGIVVLFGPAVAFGNWQAMTGSAFGFAAAGGLAYLFGMGGLYSAFSLAPVRLVAPILGSFPLISLALAALQGTVVGLAEIVAVLAVVGGIAVVAITGRDTEETRRPGTAMLWAAAGAIGFALTFWFGQEAARQGDELPAILTTRIVALLLTLAIAFAVRAPFGPLGGAGKALIGMGILDGAALGLVTASARLPNPEYASISSSLFGVLTILLAWRILKEAVAPLQWAGIATVFAGIAVLSSQG